MCDHVFTTQYNGRRVRSNPGSRVHVLYAPVFDKQGHMILEESGSENIYDFIQSHKDSVDINVLLKRFANGETGVLSRAQGAYGDFTQIPGTYAEMLNKLIDGQNYFDSLPVDVRSKFDHSFAQFVASMGTADFFEKIGVKPTPSVDSDVVKDGDPVVS